MNAMDDIVREFVVESYENLDQLDRDRVFLGDHRVWCRNPSVQPFAGTLFRDTLQVGTNEVPPTDGVTCTTRLIFK